MARHAIRIPSSISSPRGAPVALFIISAESQKNVPLHGTAATPKCLDFAAAVLMYVVMEEVLVL